MNRGKMDPVYLTLCMGGTGECILSIECVASSIPIVKYVLGLSGYVVVWADLGIGGGLVVTCGCRGQCAGLAVLCYAYGWFDVAEGACPAYRERFTPHSPRNPLHNI